MAWFGAIKQSKNTKVEGKHVYQKLWYSLGMTHPSSSCWQFQKLTVYLFLLHSASGTVSPKVTFPIGLSEALVTTTLHTSFSLCPILPSSPQTLTFLNFLHSFLPPFFVSIQKIAQFSSLEVGHRIHVERQRGGGEKINRDMQRPQSIET